MPKIGSMHKKLVNKREKGPSGSGKPNVAKMNPHKHAQGPSMKKGKGGSQ